MPCHWHGYAARHMAEKSVAKECVEMAHIEIRPARDEDREAVLAFCANTWEWGDYIGKVWDIWLHDPNGQLIVATSDGRPIGVAHLRMLSESDAWLEGLRVDPQYRRQGVGTSLNMAVQEEAMRRGATTVRLITESTNTASIRILPRVHMRQVGGFVPFRATPLMTSPDPHDIYERTQLATAADLDDIISYLNVSNVFPAAGGLYYVGFTGYTISDTLLEEQIAAQHIYLLRRWDRLDGLAIAEPRMEYDGLRLSVGYIDGTTIEAISLIAHDLRRRAAELETQSVYVYAPDLVLVRDGLAGIGYEWGGTVFYTFERGLV
jgi:ribosomal protein S18 acetylase RimI-like enzyme